MNTGIILKLIRENEGRTQETVAEALNISRAYLSQVEANKKQPSFALLKEFSEKFDIPLILLLGAEASISDGAAKSPEEQVILRQLEALFHRLLAEKAARRASFIKRTWTPETK